MCRLGEISKTASVLPLDAVLGGMVSAGLCAEALCLYLGLPNEALFDHIVRLGLRTPPDLPMRRARSGWSDDDTRRLIAWRIAGVHPEVIGANLGGPRSANAVRSKARRLGLPRPPRQSLFRPDPAQLSLVFTETSSESSPGDARNTGSEITAHPVPSIAGAPEVPRRKPGRKPIVGQRELPVFGVVAGTNAAGNATPAAKRLVPATVAEVDLSDLTWLGTLKTRREARTDPRLNVYTNRAAVWAIGMLSMSACTGAKGQSARA